MSYKIIFEKGLIPKPEEHELRAANLIAEFFNCELIFLRRGIDRTADFKIKNEIWELKSPRGNSARTMANNLRDASGQSKNVIINLKRCKMNTNQAIARIRFYKHSKGSKIEKLLVITKTGKIIDIE